jgi:hypothetical protein
MLFWVLVWRIRRTQRRICTRHPVNSAVLLIRPRTSPVLYAVYSTALPEGKNEKAVGGSSAPPVASTPTGRKAVELNPAPRKVSAMSAQPTASKPAVHLTTSQPSASTRPAKELTSSHASEHSIPPLHLPSMPTPEPSAGIFKTAVADIDDALQSGVLKPVPAGTTGWWLTYHKFKELVKFYFFGIKKLAIDHQRMAAAIRRKERAKRTWRENEFVRTYRTDLLR